MIADPRDIPGLLFWYSAENEKAYVADGGAVSTWHDLSIASRDMTKTGGSIDITLDYDGCSDGKAALVWPGGDPQADINWLTRATNPFGASGGEVIISLKPNVGGGGAYNGLWVFSSASSGAHHPYSGTIYENFGTSSRYSYAPPTDPTGWHRHYASVNASGQQSAYWNGVTAYGPSGTQSLGWSSGYAVGANNVGNHYIGLIGAMIGYDHPLTTTERADLEAWLSVNPSGGTSASTPAPTGISTSVTDTSATINWTDDVSAIGAQVRIDGGAPITASGGTYTFTGLIQTSVHDLEVRNVYSGGNSVWVKTTATLTGNASVLSYRERVLVDRPRLYYRFKEASGTTVVDETANHIDGAMIASPTRSALSPLAAGGASMSFQRSDADFLTIPAGVFPVLGNIPWSFETWAKFPYQDSSQALFWYGTASLVGTDNHVIGARLQGSNQVAVFFWANDGFANVGSLGTDWRHLVITYEPGVGRKMYVDTVEYSFSGGDAVNLLLLDGPGRIGRTANNELLEGTLAEVAIYDKVLSPTRVAAHYAGALITGTPVTDVETATETEQALSITPVMGPVSVAIQTAVETDAAQSTDSTDTGLGVGISTAAETNQALSITPVVADTSAVDVATETDQALSITPTFGPITVPIDPATETDSVSLVDVSVPGVIQIVDETDEALEIVPAITPVFGSTVDFGFSMSLEVTSQIVSITPEFRLTILDRTIYRAPASITIVVSGGEPNKPVTIKIDGTTVLTTVLNSEGGLDATSITVTVELGAVGTHNVTLHQTTSGGIPIVATDSYQIEYMPHTWVGIAVTDTDPVTVPGTVSHDTRHWVFQDLTALEDGGLGSFIFPRNPANMGLPVLEKTIKARVTTTGRPHLIGANSKPREWTFSGYCPSEEIQRAMEAYGELKRRFYIIDHRNRAWKVVITKSDFVPRKRQTFNGVITDWGSDYTITALILDQNWTTPS